MNTILERDPQQMAQYISVIPYQCGRSYVGETGRPLAVQLHEHRHNLRQGLLEELKLAQHVMKKVIG
jgi:hypothetical protein